MAELMEDTFKCPFCGQLMPVTRQTEFKFHACFGEINNSLSDEPYALVTIHRCLNKKCQKETVSIQGYNGYMNDKHYSVYPQAVYRNFPECVPEAVRTDYEEACLIRKISPKAAATLARRCLQGMIRDFWEIADNNLASAINKLEGKIRVSQWNAIDAVRKIGNIGAHMEKDINTIIDVDPNEIQLLIDLIELLIDKWYIARNEEEDMYRRLKEIADNKKSPKHP